MPQPLRGRRFATVRQITKRQERSSPRLRGYDARWDRISAEHRRLFPFCAWCKQAGRIVFAKVVDHKIPVADGGEMYAPENRWSLCIPHHGIKTSMEAYARQRGLTQSLPLWCDDPAERPAQFRGAGP